MANPHLLYYPCVTGNIGECSSMYVAISGDAESLNALTPVWQDMLAKGKIKAGDVILLTYPIPNTPPPAWYVSLLQINGDGSHQVFQDSSSGGGSNPTPITAIKWGDIQGDIVNQTDLMQNIAKHVNDHGGLNETIQTLMGSLDILSSRVTALETASKYHPSKEINK
jgi:hypothetical protein